MENTYNPESIACCRASTTVSMVSDQVPNMIKGKKKKMNKFQSRTKGLSLLTALLLGALTAGCGSGGEGSSRDPILGDTGGAVDTTRPRVSTTAPVAGAANVLTNTTVTATFTEDMDPATIVGTSFTLTGPGTTAVAGTVSYAGGARTASFSPAAALPFNTLMTATITTAAADPFGNALAGNQAALPAASNFVWTFTTATATDSTAPTVTLVNPADTATGICLQKSVNATFNEDMDPATLSTATSPCRSQVLRWVR